MDEMEPIILFYVKRYFDSYVDEESEYRKYLKCYFFDSEDEKNMIVSIYQSYPFYSANEYAVNIGYLFIDVDISFRKSIHSFYEFEKYGIKTLEDLINVHIHPSICRLYYIQIIHHLPFLDQVFIEEYNGMLVMEKLYEYIGKISDDLCMDVFKNLVIIREGSSDAVGIYAPPNINFHKLFSYLSFPYYAEPFKPVQKFNLVVQSWNEDGAGEYAVRITLDEGNVIFFDTIDVPFGEVAIYPFTVEFDRRGMHKLLFEFLKGDEVCHSVEKKMYLPYLTEEEEAEEIRRVIKMMEEVERHIKLPFDSEW